MYTKGNISSHFISLCIVILVTFSVCIKAAAAGLTLNDQSCDIPCEEVCCDVTLDDDCTPADALCIFQKYLGLPSCLD